MITAPGVLAMAAVGALARAEAGRRWNRPDGFPHGTLAVNVTGSFALGLLVDATPPFATVVGVGALGAYTTFSSFARDAVALAEAGRRRAATAYVLASCCGGTLAAALGIALASAA